MAANSKLGKFYYCRRYGEQVWERIQDIARSASPEYGEQHHKGGRYYPSFVKRTHLDRKGFWPGWVFAIVTIFEPKKVRIKIAKNEERAQWTLAVDLRNESFGIYSNRGKKFLRKRFETELQPFQDISQRTQALFLPGTPPGEYEVDISGAGPVAPLRWASGGFLPIVRYRQKHWAVLFFRDIPPIGLNVANGASEAKDEYKFLNKLIGREFSEELFLLPRRPRRNSEYSHILFEQFLPSLGEGGTDIIPSVNPVESGIETIWLCSFEMNDGEYLLDGEYDLARRILIRRPVLLLDMEFLEEQFRRNGKSMGRLIADEDQLMDDKRLPEIPAEYFALFDADIELRATRLEYLKMLAREDKRSDIEQEYELPLPKARKSLADEIELIEGWQTRYGEAFHQAREGGALKHPHLRSFCPVTWKTLELIIAHRINYHSR